MMRTKVICIVALAFIWFACPVSAGIKANEIREPAQGFCNPSWSPDGKYLLLAGPDKAGIYLYDVIKESLTLITADPSSGYRYNWSPDGGSFGCKTFERTEDGKLLQVPSIVDVASGKIIALTRPVARAGVPSFSKDGKMAFTLDTKLVILNSDREVEATYELGVYANLVPLSPDGTRVIFNDNSDRLWLLDLRTSGKTPLTGKGEGYFGPVWSPDGTRTACTTISGKLAVIDMATFSITELGPGYNPSWSPDGRFIFFSKPDGEPGRNMKGSDIWIATPDGRQVYNLTCSSADYLDDPSLSPSGELAFCSAGKGTIFTADLKGFVENISPDELSLHERREMRLPDHYSRAAAVQPPPPVISETERQASGREEIITISGVPYMHQVYDTPNWFNGNWACNATSAMMCIAYYKILPYWDCTVSVPTPHISHYGNYVSEIYSYNGFTYDTSSPDPNGDPAWGGYGYIVRNDWEDTKTFMRDYFENHGCNDVPVDWTPTWGELTAEALASYPMVVLSLITTSGHYTVSIGNFESQHTAVFNDPYGDKNDGYMNYYGAGAYYDWPGYNNGYSNLNTVGCFIFARHSQCVLPSTPVISSVVDVNSCLQNGVQVNFTSGSPATKHDLYVDGVLAVANYSSGTTYNPGNTASRSYMVKAVNSVPGCFTDSTAMSGTDAVCAPPGEAAPGGTYENGQMWSSDKNTQSWPALSGAIGYKVLRGVQGGLQYLLTTGNDSCPRYTGTSLSLDVSADDPSLQPGAFYWYLVVGTNGAGEGPAGTATGGTRIVNSSGTCN